MRFSIALSCSLFLLLLLFCTDRQIHLTFGFELLHTVKDTSTTYIIVAKSQRRVFFYLLVKLMWEFFCCFSHSCLSRKAKFTNADWQRRERVVTAVFVCVCVTWCHLLFFSSSCLSSHWCWLSFLDYQISMCCFMFTCVYLLDQRQQCDTHTHTGARHVVAEVTLSSAELPTKH